MTYTVLGQTNLEKGCVYKLIVNAEVEGEEYREVTTFDYTSFDSKGNWTKRVKMTTISYPGEPDQTSAELETRKIEYYM